MSWITIIIGVLLGIYLPISAKSTDDKDWKDNEPKCKDPVPVANSAKNYYFNDSDPFEQGCGNYVHPSSAYSGVHAIWKLCRPKPNPENCGWTENGMRLVESSIPYRCSFEKFLSRIPIAKSQLNLLSRSLVGHAILMQCRPDGIMAAYQTCKKPFGIYKMSNKELEDFHEIDSRVPNYKVDWSFAVITGPITKAIEKCNEGDHDKKTGFEPEEFNDFLSADAKMINSPPKNKPRKPDNGWLSTSWVWDMPENRGHFCVDPSRFFGRKDLYFKDNVTLDTLCIKGDHFHYPGDHAVWRMCRGSPAYDVDCGFNPRQWVPIADNIHDRCNNFFKNGEKIPRIPLARFTWGGRKTLWDKPVIFLKCEYDGIIAAEQTCNASFRARRMLWDEIENHRQIGTHEVEPYNVFRKCPFERQNASTGYKHEVFYELKDPLPKYEHQYFGYDYSSENFYNLKFL